ncbi:MAG: nucleoside kinase [Clostridiales bacterium]|nr:nucleoside kinase [Clostridiales bacterium]
MKLILDGASGQFTPGVTVKEVVKTLWPDSASQVLACFMAGDVLELGSPVDTPGELTSINYLHEEGRRIYERSLRFVLLLAMRRLYPKLILRNEHSVGQGVYMEIDNHRLTAADVSALEGHMRDIIQEDLPFILERWSKQDAIAYFRDRGDLDKANLLSYRPFDHFNMYSCGGLLEYFYGAMLPSTGYTQVFALQHHAPGLVLLLPDRADQSRPAPFISLPKQMAIFAQSNYWCKVLNTSTAAGLNDLVAQNQLRDFIRVNEALHNQSLSDIAQDVIKRQARVIFISGPSSSGKTTFANRLSIQLRVSGLSPRLISLDDFYRNRDELPLEEDGMPDLEALDALDVPLFRECVTSLLNGQETAMPRFDFRDQRRKPEPVMMQVTALQPLIIEGIHALNPALHGGFDPQLVCKIYISQLTTLNLDYHNRIRTTDARLLRRIVRDYQFRATPPERTLIMWDSVRRGEEKWVFPYQEQADIMFNSALHYELPILKTISYNILQQVPKNSVHYVKCSRILKILNYFLPVSPEVFNEIPPLSILREFIGGNTLYMKDTTSQLMADWPEDLV